MAENTKKIYECRRCKRIVVEIVGKGNKLYCECFEKTATFDEKQDDEKVIFMTPILGIPDNASNEEMLKKILEHLSKVS